MKIYLRLLLLTFLFHPNSLFGQLPQEKIEAVRQLLQKEMALQNIPGISAAVMVGNSPVWSEGFGWADIENQVPVSPQTKFRTASICKLFTATAAMKLVEQGKLDLDAPIHNYCPHYPKRQWPITARQLMSHQSGIRHYKAGRYGTDPAEFHSTRHYGSIAESIGQFKDDSLLFEPGTKYNYSTYAVSLLGCIVEDVAGEPFKTFVEKELFAPAGMTGTLPDDPFEIIPHRGQGYFFSNGNILQNAHLVDMTNKIPGGGYLTTTEDLMRFCSAFMNGKIIGATARERMFEHQQLKDGSKLNQGLGWALNAPDQPFHNERVAAHGGATPGVTGYLFMLPDRGFAVAIITNLEGVQRRNTMCQDIARIVLDLK